MYVCGHCKVRRADDALQLIRETEPAPNTITYNTIINGLRRSRKDTEAQTLLDEMINLAFPFSVSTALSRISGGLAKAMDVFLYTRKKKCEADEERGGRCLERQGCVLEEATTVSWTVMLEAYAQNGDANMVSHRMPSTARADLARAVLERMPGSDALSWAAQAYGFAQ
ncbi:hypothetical protein SELMODRAFT_427147 [Selaginella moellendorffii]|uniref:Pentacotripeptide-repeat region of PRORP domain-containing protein n=1 Tax=Selaginella moellendorffii TaxID=88036 RepID=D8SYN3_SELML|nr:hypothetical protein SELMODRAFT_427147 [Selaginella moellendorffii]